MDPTAITNYINPKLLVLIPVLYYIGTGLKRSRKINDKYIPLVLGAIGIFLAALWTFATCPCGNWRDVLNALFIAIVQGILVASASVYAHQLVKQARK